MSVLNLMENPIEHIRLLKSNWVEFCDGKLFKQECNVTISLELFGLFIEIAAEVASNRNKAIKNMLSQLSSDIDTGIYISGLVRKFKSECKKIEKLSAAEKEEAMKRNIISNVKNLQWLDKSSLEKGILFTDQVFTNGQFIELCTFKDKHKITWSQICTFLKRNIQFRSCPPSPNGIHKVC